MGIIFITAGSVLFVAAMIVRSLTLIGTANLVIGIGIQLSGPVWGGIINTTLGLLLLYAWWNRRHRRHRRTSALARSLGRCGRRWPSDCRSVQSLCCLELLSASAAVLFADDDLS